MRSRLAGVVASLVGFAGSFAVVLAGLRAEGADRVQASSGLLALSVSMGLTGIILCWRTRMPVSIAWSTPRRGAAYPGLPHPERLHGGAGAFVISGSLVLATGFSRPFERAIAAIPAPAASALLAGFLLPICLSPARAAVSLPLLGAPVIVTWLVLWRVARRLAVPGAFLAAGVALAIDGRLGSGAFTHSAPSLVATLPHFDLRTMISLGLPLSS